MNDGNGSTLRLRVMSVLAALLASAVVVRLLGMSVIAWHERSTIELTIALLAVAISFGLGAWAEYGLGLISTNPASNSLASIGVRTGGVAIAVLLVVMSPWKSQSLLVLIAGLYVVALLVDTVVWVIAVKRSNPPKTPQSSTGPR